MSRKCVVLQRGSTVRFTDYGNTQNVSHVNMLPACDSLTPRCAPQVGGATICIGHPWPGRCVNLLTVDVNVGCASRWKVDLINESLPHVSLTNSVFTQDWSFQYFSTRCDH